MVDFKGEVDFLAKGDWGKWGEQSLTGQTRGTLDEGGRGLKRGELEPWMEP